MQKQNPLIPKQKLTKRMSQDQLKILPVMTKKTNFLGKSKPSGLVKSILIPSQQSEANKLVPSLAEQTAK